MLMVKFWRKVVLCVVLYLLVTDLNSSTSTVHCLCEADLSPLLGHVSIRVSGSRLEITTTLTESLVDLLALPVALVSLVLEGGFVGVSGHESIYFA